MSNNRERSIVPDENKIPQNCVDLLLEIQIELGQLTEDLLEKSPNNFDECSEKIASIIKKLEEIKIQRVWLFKFGLSNDKKEKPT